MSQYSTGRVLTNETFDLVDGDTIRSNTSAGDRQVGLSVEDDPMTPGYPGNAVQSTMPLGPYAVTDEVDDPQGPEIIATDTGFSTIVFDNEYKR